MAGAVWVFGVGVAVVAGGRSASCWARRRCEEALTLARQLPAPSERWFVAIAQLEDRSPGDDGNRTQRLLLPVSASRHHRARARQQRALQQALDAERRGGAFLARRATPTVPLHLVPDRRD